MAGHDGARPRSSSTTRRFQQPPSPLFRDYLAGAPRVRPFYDGGALGPATRSPARPSAPLAARAPAAAVAEALAAPAGRHAGAGRAAARARARAGRRRAPPPSSPASRPVLFGGPLFVLYKALAAIKVARAPRGAARRARGAGLLGGLRRPRLRRGPLDTVLDDAGRAPHAALRARAASRSGQPASRHRPRRHDHRRWSTSCARALPGRARTATRCSSCVRALLPPGRSRSARRFARLLSRAAPRSWSCSIPSDPALKAPDGARAGARARRGARPRRGSPLEAGQRAARRRLPPAGAGAAGLPEPVRDHGRASAARWAMRERRRRGARPRPRDPGRRRRCAPGGARPGAVEPRRPAAAAGAGPPAADRRLRGRPGRDRLPRADRRRRTRTSAIPRPVLCRGRASPLVEPAQARALEAEGLDARRPAGRSRGVLAALGARGPPRGRGGLRRARARRSSARWRRSRQRWARSIPRCAPPPTPRAGARCTRSRRCTRRRLRALKKRDQAPRRPPAPHARRAAARAARSRSAASA